MHIHEYQQWVEAWDRARTWHQVLPSHTLLHALEELGEISKLVQTVEGYRDPKGKSPDEIRDELALELSDLQVMLFKIAYLCGIDMEEALRRGQAKADARFPNPDDGPAEAAAYWQRFQSYLANAGLTDSHASVVAQQDKVVMEAYKNRQF
jgi:NTP pyrophosphatase (non-canonical NTP hydrolase)